MTDVVSFMEFREKECINTIMGIHDIRKQSFYGKTDNAEYGWGTNGIGI